MGASEIDWVGGVDEADMTFAEISDLARGLDAGGRLMFGDLDASMVVLREELVQTPSIK